MAEDGGFKKRLSAALADPSDDEWPLDVPGRHASFLKRTEQLEASIDSSLGTGLPLASEDWDAGAKSTPPWAALLAAAAVVVLILVVPTKLKLAGGAAPAGPASIPAPAAACGPPTSESEVPRPLPTVDVETDTRSSSSTVISVVSTVADPLLAGLLIRSAPGDFITLGAFESVQENATNNHSIVLTAVLDPSLFNQIFPTRAANYQKRIYELYLVSVSSGSEQGQQWLKANDSIFRYSAIPAGVKVLGSCTVEL